MAKVKVRFNLGRGKNYMKWKIQYGSTSEYYSPEEYNLFMYSCQLKNHKAAADKIHQGGNKSVCAWILCDTVFLGRNCELPGEPSVQLKYNPRTQPNWLAGDAVVDNEKYPMIWSDGKKLFTNK